MRGTLIFIIIFLWKQCGAQSNFVYKNIPDKYLPSSADLAPFLLEAEKEKRDAYNLTNSLPKEYVKDGSVDYTTFIQQALYKHSKVIFPDFPIMVNKKGLQLLSNSVIIFSKYSAIVMKPNSEKGYSVLKAKDIQNCKIYFPVIIGDREEHTGSAGEWGFGIRIEGSTNISIYNPKISKCWGDGIYIGNDIKNNITSENIKIYFPILDYNRRNGISIISGKNIVIMNPVIANTYGTNPMSGLDIEPNSNNDYLDSIYIKESRTFNNGRAGIIVTIRGLRGRVHKLMSIHIDNPIDERSPWGIIVTGFKEESLYNSSISGEVKINSPIWIDNQKPIAIGSNFHDKISIKLSNISIMKRDKDGSLIHEEQKVLQVKSMLSKMKNVSY